MNYTKEEYDKIRNRLVELTIKTLGISEKAANLRIEALLKSKVLDKFGSPDELPFQIAVDCAMQIPQLGISED
jgi:hypothetical protein